MANAPMQTRRSRTTTTPAMSGILLFAGSAFAVAGAGLAAGLVAGFEGAVGPEAIGPAIGLGLASVGISSCSAAFSWVSRLGMDDAGANVVERTLPPRALPPPRLGRGACELPEGHGLHLLFRPEGGRRTTTDARTKGLFTLLIFFFCSERGFHRVF